MKIAVATLIAAAGAILATSLPASAESSYWEQRWRSRDATPEYRQGDHPRVVVKRRMSRAYERRWRRKGPPPGYYAEANPNPFRIERNDGRAHPTMNNDYWLQSSIYDFHDGKSADIKRYRY